MKRLLIGFLFANFVFCAFAAGIPESVSPESGRSNPTDVPRKDRIMGAIMGVLIGDALGVGSHWYYDLKALKKDFGPWISDYSDPQPNGATRHVDIHKHRYEEGVRAGDVSQTGQLIIMLLESVAEKGTYDRKDFSSRVDKLFEMLDGTRYSGRYTDVAIRETWKHRHDGTGWDDPKVGCNHITSEAAQMNTILAALYYKDATRLIKEAYRNTKLFYYNDIPITDSVSYALVVSGLINDVGLINPKAYIPYEGLTKYFYSIDRGSIPYFPLLDSPTQLENTFFDPEITFEPPHLISKVYGMHCGIQQLLPASYYLIHRYPDNFEKAVLAAINGGGNGMARAALTGGMSGAMVGLKGIPDRFIKGLKDHKRLLKLAEKVAELAVK